MHSPDNRSLHNSLKWELIWHDEFDGPAGNGPDPQKWLFDLGGHGWGNEELQSYTALTDNVAMDGNSALVIKALKAPNPIASNLNCWYGPCRYTSARLHTRGLFEFTYGRVEARLKLPYGQGLWPAFWMLAADIEQNPWPHCGEIDVMEHIGQEPKTIHGTVHGPGYFGGQAIGGSYVLDTDRAFKDDFHEFAVEWMPDEICWFVDDDPFFSVTPNQLPPEDGWVFNRPFYLLLNVAVGGIWPGSPDQQTVFPQQMTIDYIRVYKARKS